MVIDEEMANKRKDFEEEERSGMASMAVDAPMDSSPTVQVRNPPARRWNIWARTSRLEKILIFCVLILVIIIIILSVHKSFSSRSDETEYCLTPACVTAAANLLNAIDQTADPCTDFYQYACGGWLKDNRQTESATITDKISDNNHIIMKNALEDDSSETKSEAENKARLYYKSCLDKNETVEKLGDQPMHDLLRKIGGWPLTGDFNINQWRFQRTMELLHNQYGYGALFYWSVTVDRRNSSINVIQLDVNDPGIEEGTEGTTLGLPTNNYYLGKGEDQEVLNAYLNYMIKVGVLLGGEEQATRDQMEKVLEFEKKLSNCTVIESENGGDKYHKMTVNQLRVLAPFLDWSSFFNSAFKQINRKITLSQELVLNAPEYMKKMSELVTQYLATTDGKIVISNYLGWSLVRKLALRLPHPYREAAGTVKKALSGSEDGEKSWEYCLQDTNEVIGFAVGAMFVREAFKGDSKPEAEDMINEIRHAFKANFPKLKWMDLETRKLAEEKVDAITNMIGFPDFILDPKQLDEEYEGLEFSEDGYFNNNVAVKQHEVISAMRKLDEPPSRNRWEMSPQTFNAYYSPTGNQIVFPAAMLQSPFYDARYPKYLNFGAMGVVMGHELTHGFDDQGRKYDKKGNLNQWWKNSTIEKYHSRTSCLEFHYSRYEENGEELNGRLTLGENIADNGGLKAAFNAYQNWAKKHPPEPLLPGVPLTKNQIFFIGFGQVWCSIQTPEDMRLHILTNEHSPNKFRVLGTVTNSFEFAREFKCPKNSEMNPEFKCQVW